MVFQHYALYPHMTIRENMAFGLRNIGTSEGRDRACVSKPRRRAWRSAHLLDRKPGQLSGGQRQRVAIAPRDRQAARSCSCSTSRCRTSTRRFACAPGWNWRSCTSGCGTTMIFVTHDQVEAMTLADRIVVLNDGRIEQVGTPMDIYLRPATRFVATFVGSPTINLLPGKVADARRQGARDAGRRHPAADRGADGRNRAWRDHASACAPSMSASPRTASAATARGGRAAGRTHAGSCRTCRRIAAGRRGCGHLRGSRGRCGVAQHQRRRGASVRCGRRRPPRAR